MKSGTEKVPSLTQFHDGIGIGMAKNAAEQGTTSMSRNSTVNSAAGKTVPELVARARAAMDRFCDSGQDRVDMAVRAVAWAVYNPVNARRLAEYAVEDTGLGNVESKIIKNRRKTFGTLRDLMRVRTVGVIEDDPLRGLVKYGKPVGVVGAVCPSTNPSATPVNKAMMAIKGGNAVIIAPSPAGWRTSCETVHLMRLELANCGAPVDLVQVLPDPVTKASTQELLEAVDLAVVTGSQNNVRRAMTSGTVAIGVGPGNVPVIIDSSADLKAAARKIAASKCFDNATSCSSENAVILLDDVYPEAIHALQEAGGWLCDHGQRNRIAAELWKDGKLNREVIARSAHHVAGVFGLPRDARDARFFMVEEEQVDGPGSFADEKLSLVLSVYRAKSIRHALDIADALLLVKGRGHSAGIHTADMSHASMMAERLDVVRVLVNQAHTFGNGGSFDNSMPFTLSMGGGTWAGNTISENLNYRHFINITHLVTTIPEDRPEEEDLFSPFWDLCDTRSGTGSGCYGQT